MRAVVQRVTEAKVAIDQEIVGAIRNGMLVLIGVEKEDTSQDVQQLASKCVELRIFDDGAGKMNRSLLETAGQMLVVSQFTLHGDCRKGRRPSFINAASSDVAKTLYEDFVTVVQDRRVHVETGVFQANMQVTFTNDGPVTILLDTKKTF